MLWKYIFTADTVDFDLAFAHWRASILLKVLTNNILKRMFFIVLIAFMF